MTKNRTMNEIISLRIHRAVQFQLAAHAHALNGAAPVGGAGQAPGPSAWKPGGRPCPPDWACSQSGHHRKEQEHDEHDQMHRSLKHCGTPPGQGHRRKQECKRQQGDFLGRQAQRER